MFVANVLTIDRMSALQSRGVKTISTTDDDVELSSDEQLLDQAGDGSCCSSWRSMIFGVAKAISREHNAIGNCKTVVFDLSEVSHLGVTAAIALENAVRKRWRSAATCSWSGPPAAPKRLQKLKLLERLPEQNITPDRLLALQRAVALSPADA